MFRGIDIFWGAIFFVVLLMIFSIILRKYKDDKLKRLFLQAFYFKMACTVGFMLLIIFYYKGGDTGLYYDATGFLRNAVMDDGNNIGKIFTTKVINVKTPLMNYFIFTNSIYPVFEAMNSPGNFLVPKFALLPSLVFDNSYICIAMFFSFFALGGSIRLFKFFYHYFPGFYREIALATLFLPSAAFWSSGLLKDPICFGAVGYLVYAIFNIFIRRKKIVISILWAVLASILLFYIKVYILLAIAPALVVWLFREVNKHVENKTLRSIMTFMTLAIGGVLAITLINYVTSDESMKAFRFDTLLETSQQNRELYAGFSEQYEGSYFEAGSSNPFMMMLNGIVASLFRPFPWEARNIPAMLSALEALLFFYLTLNFMFRKGLMRFFRDIFSDPVLMLCFIFSIVFAAAVGSTALNFGSLSRYKIPCLPFYLMMVLVINQQAGVKLPDWFRKMLGYKKLRPEHRIQKAV
jgi:hypothetical protein